MISSGATALVVEDESLLREIMCEWLELEGYRVLGAEHGAEALRRMETNSIDVIVTDIRMPVMDGLSLLKRLQASPGNLPAVIVVSGFTELTGREAYDLGVETILSKPFTDDLLLDAVRRVLTPREELWRLPARTRQSQDLQATFSTVDSARQSGTLAFGRNGFCLRSQAMLREGPVKFALNFPDEALSLAGQGEVRWIQPAEGQIGIEICGLEAACLTQGVRLTAGSGARCSIPHTSLSGDPATRA